MKKFMRRAAFILIILLILLSIYLKLTWPENIPIEVPEFSTRTLFLSPDCKYVATFDSDLNLKLFDRNKRNSRTITNDRDDTMYGRAEPAFIFFTPDQKKLICGGRAFDATDQLTLTGGAVQVRDIASGRLLRTLTTHNDCGSAALLSPDGHTLIYGSQEGSIVFRDINSGNTLGVIAPHQKLKYICMDISADGNRLALTYANLKRESGVIMCDMSTRKVLWNKIFESKFIPMGSLATALKFIPDSQTIVTLSDDRVLTFVDISSAKVKSQIKMEVPYDVPPGGSAVAAFSPDGKLLASGGYRVTIWNVSDGSIRRSLQGGGGVKFSSDGRILASHSLARDRTANLDEPDVNLTREITLWKRF